jgi:hypothetical protein
VREAVTVDHFGLKGVGLKVGNEVGYEAYYPDTSRSVPPALTRSSGLEI